MVCLKAASFLICMYGAIAIIALHFTKYILKRINEEDADMVRRFETTTWLQAAQHPVQPEPHGTCIELPHTKQNEQVPFFLYSIYTSIKTN